MFDTSLLTEGRFILTDGILHFFSALHICVLLWSFSDRHGGQLTVLNHVLNGVTLGMASTCKNTAWGLMALDAWVYVVEFLPLVEWSGVLDYLVEVAMAGTSLFAMVLGVYCLCFAGHFALLPYQGSGSGYLPDWMKRQLVRNTGEKLFARAASGRPVLWRVGWLSVRMHTGNMQITKFHVSQSWPASWPFMTGHVVGFWHGGGQSVYCNGNVFVYYLAMVGVVGACFFPRQRTAYFSVAWAGLFFPFFLIPRVLYNYHYLLPLIAGAMAFGALIDHLPRRLRGAVCVVAVAASAFGFWLWCPWSYGWRRHEHEKMVWNKNWMDGDRRYKYGRAVSNGENVTSWQGPFQRAVNWLRPGNVTASGVPNVTATTVAKKKPA
jgi:dolichyl-phosphate-mannose--protein O-mannosyl transferase